MVVVIGGFVGGLLACATLTRLWLWILRAWHAGIVRVLAAHTASLATACALAAMGFAASQGPAWSAGRLYVLPQFALLAFDLLRRRAVQRLRCPTLTFARTNERVGNSCKPGVGDEMFTGFTQCRLSILKPSSAPGASQTRWVPSRGVRVRSRRTRTRRFRWRCRSARDQTRAARTSLGDRSWKACPCSYVHRLQQGYEGRHAHPLPCCRSETSPECRLSGLEPMAAPGAELTSDHPRRRAEATCQPASSSALWRPFRLHPRSRETRSGDTRQLA